MKQFGNPLFLREPPLPLSTKPPTFGQFFCDPLFFQISKMRTPPSNFRGGDPPKIKNHIFLKYFQKKYNIFSSYKSTFCTEKLFKNIKHIL